MFEHFKRRIALGQAYRDTFERPEGKLVLADLLRAGGVLETSFHPGDAHATAFAEGRRAVALHILAQLRWSEGELRRLAEERTDERLAAPADAGASSFWAEDYAT